MNRSVDILYLAAAVRDAGNVAAQPGLVALRQGRVVAAGHPSDPRFSGLQARHTIELPNHLLLPSLVNAHSHLMLTSVGPRPYTGDFVDWLRSVIRDGPTDSQAIIDSVLQGLELSTEAGVGFLGDIAGIGDSAITARREAGPRAAIPGVSYLECFGLDHDAPTTIEAMERRVRSHCNEWAEPSRNHELALGISPHAPYSAGMKLYAAASQLSHSLSCRLTTHLAETVEEIQFVRDGTGPCAELLRDLGKWDASIRPTGMHPIDWLAPQLRRRRWLLAHCNYVEDEHLDLLARCGASVVYCPLASEYFGHTGHRYRHMLAAGANVCLGTDSILCQPPENSQPMGILPQMRRLFRRDGTAADTLLEMATVNGLSALELDPVHATLQPGARTRLSCVEIDPDDRTEPFTQALENDYPLTPVPTGEKTS